MRNFRHLLEYFAVSLFIKFIGLFNIATVRNMAVIVSDLMFYILPIRKQVVLDNLTKAFGKDKTPEEISQIAKNNYRQFAKTFFEIMLLPKLNAREIEKLVKMENTVFLDEAIKNGKGAILVGAHFGNWELMGVAVAARYPLTFLVGEQTNLLVDNLLNSIRTSKGVKTIPLKFALRGVMKTLKANEFVAIISDQDAHENGSFVDFFGRPASTPKAAALFSLRSGCPLITGHCVRNNYGYRVVFDRIDLPARSGDEESDARALTALYTSKIESYVRANPDHWFWMHKRWKTRPA
jgi:KDO2-lipid IV(A) lauroyltransferase